MWEKHPQAPVGTRWVHLLGAAPGVQGPAPSWEEMLVPLCPLLPPGLVSGTKNVAVSAGGESRRGVGCQGWELSLAAFSHVSSSLPPPPRCIRVCHRVAAGLGEHPHGGSGGRLAEELAAVIPSWAASAGSAPPIAGGAGAKGVRAAALPPSLHFGACWLSQQHPKARPSPLRPHGPARSPPACPVCTGSPRGQRQRCHGRCSHTLSIRPGPAGVWWPWQGPASHSTFPALAASSPSPSCGEPSSHLSRGSLGPC